MSKTNKDTIKIQTTVRGIAAWLYKSLDKGLRAKALELGLRLLAEDEQLRKIFFTDEQMVIEILNTSKEQIEPKSKPKTEPKKLEDIDRWNFKGE